MQQANIIWDWNGTLLDDLNLCISSINTLLGKRQLSLLDKTTYQEVFSFPVRDYYSAIGFDFSTEDFSIPAHEFIQLYEAGVKECPLHKDAVKVLSQFRESGLKQYVLSAMQQEMLVKTLKHNRIFHFFEGIAGLDDHYAVSKVERGKLLFDEFYIDTDNTWLVGDTLHDYEVAQALGIKCILIADGHQSKERLKHTGTFVYNRLIEILDSGFF